MRLFLFVLLIPILAGASDFIEITSQATASQTTSHSSGSYPAELAIDGDPSTFNHTDSGGMGGALILDFSTEEEISRTELLTRDCCGGRLNGATLRLFDAEDSLVYEVPVIDDGPATTFSVDLPEGILASRVRIGFDSDQTGIVHIAELKIFSSVGDPPVIDFFTASGTTLSWSVSGANTVEIFGIGVVPESGSKFVSPAVSKEYILSGTNECATVRHSAVVEVGGKKLKLRITEFSAYPDDWVEIWNPGNEVIDLTGWALTDDREDLGKWHFGNGQELSAAEFLVIEEPFGLAREDGSYLALIDQTGMIVSEVTYPRQSAGISYGVDLAGDARYFLTETPGHYNISETSLGRLEGVDFSVERGFYDSALTLELAPQTPGAEVFYSLDAGDPEEKYISPLIITGTSVVKAIEVREGYEASFSETHSFIFTDDVAEQKEFPLGFPEDWQPPGSSGALAPIPRPSDYEMDPEVVSSAPFTDGKGLGFSMADALKSIPTICLTLPNEQMWGFEEGIHPNATLRGDDWERFASMELIDPVQGEYHHFNCGLRIHGGRGRVREMLRKSFRLYFRGDYGATKFDYPLFEGMPDGGVDHLILRGGTGRTWASPWRDFSGSGNALDKVTYLRDQFYRDCQRIMGNPSIAGSFAHLYINGLYWGLYNPVERPGSAFVANHFGGKKEDYDFVKWANGLDPVALEGDMEGWDELVQLTRGDVETNWVEIQMKLDVANLIDYMMINFYAGNNDWIRNNSYGFRAREGDQRFRFLCWDGEEYFNSLSRNSTTDGRNKSDTPLELHDNLRAGSLEYRLMFADRLHRHLLDEDGVLTSSLARERHDRLVEEIDRAIVGESARWGDILRPTNPYLRGEEWLDAVDVVNTYIQQRPGISFNHMEADNLFPPVNVPKAEMIGSRLVLSEGSGESWYTLDGSDPRLEGGAINPLAVRYDSSRVQDELISVASWRFLDTGQELSGEDWVEVEYEDSEWDVGRSPLGYGVLGSNEAGYVELETFVGFGDDFIQKHITTYFRHSFELETLEGLENLELRYQCDDGAVIYLNGEEVERRNLPGGEIGASELALESLGGAEEVQVQVVPISAESLRIGTNVIAVEVHQGGAGSSDLLFDLSLVSISSGIPVDGDIQIKARSLQGGTWSALEEEVFQDPQSAQNLVVSEVMYHPVGPSPAEEAMSFDDDDLFEFIELKNVGSGMVILNGMRFSKGVDVSLSGMIPAGELGLVVANRQAFGARYGNGFNIVGEWGEGSRLDNGGELIRLRGIEDEVLLEFLYDDEFPVGH